MLFRKTRDQVINESIAALSSSGVVTNLNAGGVARSLIEIIGGRLGELYDSMSFNMAMRYPSTAASVYLDLIGESMGIRRAQPTKAFASADDKIFRFYVPTGFLAGSIPSKVIPTGTSISSADGTIVFRTTAPFYFSDVAQEVFVSAEAVEAGTSYNVGAGGISTHTLGSSVLVENTSPIETGTDIETDESFRYRLVNSYLGLQQSNPIALRLAAVTVPNVKSAIMREYASGVGSCELLLVPTTTTLNKSTIEAARRVLDNTRAAGVKISVREPDYIPMSIVVRLTFKKTATEQQKVTARSRVRTSIIDYLDDIPLGGTLVINELRQRIMASDPNIFDLNITCITIDGRKQLPVNFTLGGDELFVLDSKIDDPVQIL